MAAYITQADTLRIGHSEPWLLFNMNLQEVQAVLPPRWFRRVCNSAIAEGFAEGRRMQREPRKWGGYVQDGYWCLLAARDVVSRFIAEHLPRKRPVSPAASDAEVCAKAETIARAMAKLLESFSSVTLDAAAACIKACTLRGFDIPKSKTINGMVLRAKCRLYWRREIRRVHARGVERSNIRLNYVHANSDPYASDDAVKRRTAQNARNARTLENTLMQSQDTGQIMTLADAARASVSNKAIRRGELMLRLRGMEDCATDAGYGAVMFTITCPSRFHAVRKLGNHCEPNPAYDGSTPRDAQAYLRTVWARIRAQLARQGVSYFGMRVAEPHHDACPHWHGLIFANEIEALQRVIRDYALRDSPDEPGAKKHRVDFEPIDSAKGSAVGYIAKYISKNIDGHGVGDYTTRDGFKYTTDADLLGDVKVHPAKRIEAWAATWGIRQFQQLGGAPVGVWRELRRVDGKSIPDIEGENKLLYAWWAANRCGAEGEVSKPADWHEFCKIMGGVAGEGRQIGLYTIKGMKQGRYGEVETVQPRGVVTYASVRIVRGICDYYAYSKVIAPSNRQVWREYNKSSGLSGALSFASNASPWTRFNNCTPDGVLEEQQRYGQGTLSAFLSAGKNLNLTDHFAGT